MGTLQNTLTNLMQLLELHSRKFDNKEYEKLGAVDMYYLEAIYQLKTPTIGTISKLLKQSTPNTNYHIKKLIELGLVKKKLDEKDRRVTHLSVTQKYLDILFQEKSFWGRLEEDLKENTSPEDYAVFMRVLDDSVESLSQFGKKKRF